ncbi:hypothetical protein ABZV31_27265 [Streptomyces sp. NPDC005202]|uniref:hypothetical protein n=1 Tax=Streptomyces sp. NPDC005202 TaxID=3157021 RepID=UPI0033B2EFC2
MYTPAWSARTAQQRSRSASPGPLTSVRAPATPPRSSPPRRTGASPYDCDRTVWPAGAPSSSPTCPLLRSAITASQRRLTLRTGQGYLLDNHRWLHARTRFTGDRRLLHALGEPRFALPDGFTPCPTASVLPRTSEAV